MKKIYIVFAALTVMSTFGVKKDEPVTSENEPQVIKRIDLIRNNGRKRVEPVAFTNAQKAIRRCDLDAVQCEVAKLAETCPPASLKGHLETLLGKIDDAIMGNKYAGDPQFEEQHALGTKLLIAGAAGLAGGFIVGKKGTSFGLHKFLARGLAAVLVGTGIMGAYLGAILRSLQPMDTEKAQAIKAYLEKELASLPRT